MADYTVLSTKKLDASLVAEAAEAGIKIIEQEAIRIKRIWSEEKLNEVKKFLTAECVVFTSANAVTIVHDYILAAEIRNPLPWKIFTLSGKTKDSLSAFPVFSKTAEEAKNASHLAREIIGYDIKEIVFFCGNKRRDELPVTLKEAGIKVHEVVVYETEETPGMATDDVDAALFFSPSAVTSFFSVNQLKETTICFAIGETTATAIAAFTNNKLITSPEPSQEAMISTVQSYFKK